MRCHTLCETKTKSVQPQRLAHLALSIHGQHSTGVLDAFNLVFCFDFISAARTVRKQTPVSIAERSSMEDAGVS